MIHPLSQLILPLLQLIMPNYNIERKANFTCKLTVVSALIKCNRPFVHNGFRYNNLASSANKKSSSKAEKSASKPLLFATRQHESLPFFVYPISQSAASSSYGAKRGASSFELISSPTTVSRNNLTVDEACVIRSKENC